MAYKSQIKSMASIVYQGTVYYEGTEVIKVEAKAATTEYPAAPTVNETWLDKELFAAHRADIMPDLNKVRGEAYNKILSMTTGEYVPVSDTTTITDEENTTE